MAWMKALAKEDLPAGSKKTVNVGETGILLVHAHDGSLYALEAKCPHAGAPLEKGAICDGRLICPWHAGTFALKDGSLVEPPPLRALKTYSVKVENGAILVDPKPLTVPTLAERGDGKSLASIGAEKHVVTIGAGVAAAAAACTLRQGGFAGTITLVDPIEDEPIDRTMLTKAGMDGSMPVAKLPLFQKEEAAKLDLKHVRSRVTALDAKRRSLTTDGGETIRFDAALVAPGGTPKQLDIPGESLPHVLTVRHTRDLETLNGILGKDAGGKPVVIVGDSFIAFESASALKKRGCDVTLVCRSPQPFSKKFGEAPAHALVSLHKAHGVLLKTGAEARRITEEAVELKSGETLPAQLVIVAVGVEPALHFEHGFPLADDGGVAVDESLSAAENVWVAGDIASVGSTRIEHWRLAEQHGQRAANAMLRAFGADAEELPKIVPFFWTAHFGKRFGYVGHAEGWDDIQVDGSLGDQKFLAYYGKKGKVAAVLACGMDTELAMLAESMRKPLTLAEARKAAASA